MTGQFLTRVQAVAELAPSGSEEDTASAGRLLDSAERSYTYPHTLRTAFHLITAYPAAPQHGRPVVTFSVSRW